MFVQWLETPDRQTFELVLHNEHSVKHLLLLIETIPFSFHNKEIYANTGDLKTKLSSKFRLNSRAIGARFSFDPVS
jgi:hypothetical protein